MQKLLEKAGLKVLLTRKTEADLSVAKRLAAARPAAKALLISIQFNTGAEEDTGVQTDILAPRGVATPPWGDEMLNPHPGNEHDAENIALATAVHASVVVSSKMYDNGIHHVRTPLLNELKMPAVILRCGFLGNSYDAGMLGEPDNRERLAASIARAVATYRRAVGASPKVPTSSPVPK